jgi:hypothetical protein
MKSISCTRAQIWRDNLKLSMAPLVNRGEGRKEERDEEERGREDAPYSAR